MSKKIITIVGITGTQGSAVANSFIDLPGWQVRGITRNSTSDKARALTARGVHLISADLDDVENLRNAFIGSNAIFVVTDYVTNMNRVASNQFLQGKAAEAGKSLHEYAGDLETQQGINAALAASDPKVLKTLERYVFSTLPSVTKISNGKYTNAPEFDSKAAAEAYIRENLPGLTKRMSTVTMGNYLENWGYIPALAPQKAADGVYEFLWLDCEGEHLAHPELWVKGDAGRFVKALVVHQPAGVDVLACSEEITSVNYAEKWSKAMGLPARSKVVSQEEYAAFVPEEIREAFVDLVKFVTEFGVGDLKRARDLCIEVAGIEAFVQSQQWRL